MRASRGLGTTLLAAILAHAGVAAPAPSAPPAATSPLEISADEQLRILKQLCQARHQEDYGDDPDSEGAWAVTKDERGWLCENNQPPDESPFSSELRWSSARRGRFVAADGEWLVSLQSGCLHGCRGMTYILKRASQGWQVLHEEETLVKEACAVLRAPDGFDRVACLVGGGPLQGLVTEALLVSSFVAGRSRFQRLLDKEHGSECYLARRPPPAEHDLDTLSMLTAPRSAAGAALTVRLQVRRLGCEVETDDPDSLAQVKAEHVLRFVWRGDELVPDAASADLIRRYDWAQAP
jgi:hypothetical protein